MAPTDQDSSEPTSNPAGEGVVQMSEEEARQQAMICHLLSFLGLTGVLGIVTNTPYPILGLLGPLALWIWKREKSPFLDRHGKEAVNFNITLLIYSIALSLLGVVGVLLLALFFAGLLILIPVGIASFALLVFWIVVVIQAAKAAYEGQFYEYPITFRFIR